VDRPTDLWVFFLGGVCMVYDMLPDFIGSLIWDDVAVYATNNNYMV
jgi:hypothetical protein